MPTRFPAVAYIVKRDSLQLWALHSEGGLLSEELLLDLGSVPTITLDCLNGYSGYRWGHSLAFSPDGQYLAITFDRSDSCPYGTLILRVADRRVYLPRGFELLAWIPRSERFVGANSTDWGTLSVDGSGYVQLPSVGGVLDAVVSGDGQKIIFARRWFTKIPLGIVDADGVDISFLQIPGLKEGDFAYNLALSPDGQRFAFTWSRGIPVDYFIFHDYHGVGQVWIMGVDGAGEQPLGPDYSVDFDLAWSSDGRSIVLVRQDFARGQIHDPAESLVSSLWIIDVESGQWRVLLPSEDKYAHWSPRWLPDSSGVVFLSNRGGEANIWFVYSDGTGLQQLTRQGSLADDISISP